MGKYDIHFQPVPQAEAFGYKCFEFGFQAPVKVTGFQSLINRWVKTLMTPLGSDPIEPEAGTSFGNLIGANLSRVTSDVQDLVNMAVADASEQVLAQDLVGFFSSNERLQSAEVYDYVETDTGFDVWVLIKNVAGDELNVPVASL